MTEETMTTSNIDAVQAARDLLERMEIPGAQELIAGSLVELADLIASQQDDTRRINAACAAARILRASNVFIQGAFVGHALEITYLADYLRGVTTSESEGPDGRVSPVALGQAAYGGYVDASGGVSLISGAPLPAWDGQAPEVRDAWVAAASRVRAELGVTP